MPPAHNLHGQVIDRLIVLFENVPAYRSSMVDTIFWTLDELDEMLRAEYEMEDVPAFDETTELQGVVLHELDDPCSHAARPLSSGGRIQV